MLTRVGNRQEDRRMGGAAPMESAVPVTVMVTEQVTKEGNGLGEAGLPLEAEEWSEGADPGGTMVPSEQGFNYRSRAFREDTPHPSALQRGKSKEQFRSWVLGGGEGEATGLLPARDSASMVSTGGQAVAFMGWAGSSWRQLTGVCFLHLGVHGAGAGGSCRLCFCSEATFQDDVVAVIAFSFQGTEDEAGLILEILHHLIADHHVDASGALPVHSVDVLWGDAVQVGNLLNQLQGGQLLQEDGVVHTQIGVPATIPLLL